MPNAVRRKSSQSAHGMSVRSLAVIPARGGSKRLPRKNLLPLCGAPLIAWTIAAMQQAKRPTDWLVSTDDEEIADIARRYGAPLPFMRPPEIATDTVRNSDVLIHALHFMEKMTGAPYDIIVLLQPTCPIRDPRHIDEAIDRLAASSLPTLASVRGPYKKRDPNLKRISPDGSLEDYCPLPPDGSWEPFYIYNAAIYAIRRAWLVEHRSFVSPRQVPLPMDEMHSTDIDTMPDFITAEARVRYLGRTAPKEIAS